MAQDKFFKSVYEVIKQVPRGKVVTYGQIAKILGVPRWSQIVGYALHVNPHPDLKALEKANASGLEKFSDSLEQDKIVEGESASKAQACVPCHRVVNRFGQVCTGFAFGGGAVQRRLLEEEGVVFEADGKIDLKKFQWQPNLNEIL